MSEKRSLKKKFKRALCSLSLAFGCAASPAFAVDTAPPAPPPVPAATTMAAGLWKVDLFNAVISVKECPGQNACASLYWVDPADERIFDDFAKPEDIRKKQNEVDSQTPPYGAVTREDILALCGFSPKLDIHQVAPGAWEGTMEIRGRSVTMNMNISMLNDNELKVVASKFLFRHEENWHRVQPGDMRYPPCRKPGL